MATPIPAKAVLEFTPRPRTLPRVFQPRLRQPDQRLSSETTYKEAERLSYAKPMDA